MAMGQQPSNREAKKPKKERPKAAPAMPSAASRTLDFPASTQFAKSTRRWTGRTSEKEPQHFARSVGPVLICV